MAIQLNVALIHSDLTLLGERIWDEQGQVHGRDSCWWACICMLSYYRVAGPRYGLPEMFSSGIPLVRSPQEVDTFLPYNSIFMRKLACNGQLDSILINKEADELGDAKNAYIWERLLQREGLMRLPYYRRDQVSGELLETMLAAFGPIMVQTQKWVRDAAPNEYHSVVMTGIDRQKNIVFLNDPSRLHKRTANLDWFLLKIYCNKYAFVAKRPYML